MKKRFCASRAGLASPLGCGKEREPVVAKVADRKITVGDFNKAVATMDEKFLPKTNDLEGKKELDIAINKEVTTLKALAAGYEKDKAIAEFMETFQKAVPRRAMENEYVVKKVKVTDQEAKDYFDKMHNEYTLSQILVASEDEARAVREQPSAGPICRNCQRRNTPWVPGRRRRLHGNEHDRRHVLLDRRGPREHERRGYHRAPCRRIRMGDPQGAQHPEGHA